MLVLVGETHSRRIVERLREMGWGRMYVSRRPKPYLGEPWGFDNGSYRCFRSGVEFDTNAFLQRIERAFVVGTPYMAVVPDIVEGGLRSLEFSVSWLDRLPPWPWYMAVQDGMSPSDVAPYINKLSGIFLGGSTPYKVRASEWSQVAHAHGKLFHYGRCGTLRKLAHARRVGADSLDSAFPLWTTKRFELFASHWMYGNPQGQLFSAQE